MPVKLLKRLMISETSCDFVLLAEITSVFPREEVIVVILQPATRKQALLFWQILLQPVGQSSYLKQMFIKSVKKMDLSA